VKDRPALRFSRDRIVPEENNHSACGVCISWLPVEHAHPFGSGLHAPDHFDQRHYDKVESRIMPLAKLITTSASVGTRAMMTSSLIRLVSFKADPALACPTSPFKLSQSDDPNIPPSSLREYMIECLKKYIIVHMTASWGDAPTKERGEIRDWDNNNIESSHRTEITEWKFGSGRKKDWRHYNVFRPFCKTPAVRCQQPKSAKKLPIKIPHQRLTWNPQPELGMPVHTILQLFPPTRKSRRRLHREDKKRHSKYRVDRDDYLSDRDNFNVPETKAPRPVRRWVLAEHAEAGAN
jgi:hypothetical protein